MCELPPSPAPIADHLLGFATSLPKWGGTLTPFSRKAMTCHQMSKSSSSDGEFPLDGRGRIKRRTRASKTESLKGFVR